MRQSNLDRLFSDAAASDYDLVARFLMAFARFEYALKAAGYVESGLRGEPIVVWRGFGRDVRQPGSLPPEVSTAQRFLVEQPPRRQVVASDGELRWVGLRLSRSDEIGNLIQCLKTVRNNLFHGGKSSSGVVPDLPRDRRLLESCLVVMDALLDWHPEVRGYFVEPLYGRDVA